MSISTLPATYTQILCKTGNGILTITLNRPDRLNAFTETMRDELIRAFEEADSNDEIRAVIVTGSGRAFCAGADLGRGGATFDHRARGGTAEPSQHRDGGGLVTLAIYECRKPIIAAINGPAVGVGITMTLPMDIRLASEDSKIGFVFARRGITPEACSTWFLPRIVGISKAAEWIYTGRVFSAQEALNAGLVSRLCKPEELLPAAEALAGEIAENTSAMSVALSRQMLWRALGADHPIEAHRIESRSIHFMGASADAREGVQAFLEKRPAKFSMKVSSDMPAFYPWWKERPF